MSIFDRPDFDEMFHNAIYNSREDVVDAVDIELDDWDDDGQPDFHTEMQGLYGGDDYPDQWEVDEWD